MIGKGFVRPHSRRDTMRERGTPTDQPDRRAVQPTPTRRTEIVVHSTMDEGV
jgi:hypothetical protein